MSLEVFKKLGEKLLEFSINNNGVGLCCSLQIESTCSPGIVSVPFGAKDHFSVSGWDSVRYPATTFFVPMPPEGVATMNYITTAMTRYDK